MKLTAKQKAFVREYLIDLNGAQAAIRAGYSKKTARMIANENLTKPDIAAAIQSEMDKRAERTQVTSDKVIRETALVAFFNPLALFDDKGEWLSPKDWPEGAGASIKSLDFVTDEDGITRVRRVAFWDKVKGLELLGKHLKTWDGNTESESKERDLIKDFLRTLAPTVGPPSLRKPVKGTLVEH